jgi:flagellar basal-body rod protein FlgF
MDRLIYLAMSGAKATMQRQETLANNLANVSTSAFAPSWRRFAPCRSKAAARARASMRSSRRRLRRVAGAGRGDRPQPRRRDARGAWLAVQALDGTEAYTRGGSLDIDRRGQRW